MAKNIAKIEEKDEAGKAIVSISPNKIRDFQNQENMIWDKNDQK